jgi:hypothetical protein
VLDAFDDLFRIVRNADEAIGVIRDWSYKPEFIRSHILHRANRCADVDGILRFDEDDSDLFEEGIRHAKS